MTLFREGILGEAGADSLVTTLLIILLIVYLTDLIALVLLARKFWDRSRGIRELMSILYIK